MKYLIGVVVLVGLASAGTYWRYQSFNPCDWMEQDLAQESSLPELAIEAKIRAEFLLDGIVEPGPGDCLTKWWHLRSEGLGQETKS